MPSVGPPMPDPPAGLGPGAAVFIKSPRYSCGQGWKTKIKDFCSDLSLETMTIPGTPHTQPLLSIPGQIGTRRGRIQGRAFSSQISTSGKAVWWDPCGNRWCYVGGLPAQDPLPSLMLCVGRFTDPKALTLLPSEL